MDSSEVEFDVNDLKANELLVAEFSYIAAAAFQANEDRARVFQLFFVTFGTFIAALLSSQVENNNVRELHLAFAILFLLNAVFGALTIFHLARLRLAWRDCALAMNQMKAKLIEKNQDFKEYFRWRADTLPPTFKVNSISFILALMVALLTGFAAGAATAFLGLAQSQQFVPWKISGVIGFAVTGISIFICYWLPLKLEADA